MCTRCTIVSSTRTLCMISDEKAHGWSVCRVMIPTKLLKRKWAAFGGRTGKDCRIMCRGFSVSFYREKKNDSQVATSIQTKSHHITCNSIDKRFYHRKHFVHCIWVVTTDCSIHVHAHTLTAVYMHTLYVQYAPVMWQTWTDGSGSSCRWCPGRVCWIGWEVV